MTASVLGGADRTLAEGETARQRMADMMREMFEKGTNTDLSDVSDSEMLDCFSYTAVPEYLPVPGHLTADGVPLPPRPE